MPVNNYFRNFNSMVQQELINDLTREVIEINGLEVYYVIRENSNVKDTIYNEEPTARFLNARKVEMYINTPEGFEGAGDLVSKFGLDVVDELILIANRERFVDEVKIGTPREGDLIYLPLGKGLFEIKFVEHEKPFYQLGKNHVFEMTCELFRYNNQIFDVPQQEMGVMFNKIERENSITRKFTVGTQFNANDQFVISETVRGATSGATGKVASQSANTLHLYRVSGLFQVGETINGQGLTPQPLLHPQIGSEHTNTIIAEDDQVIESSEYDDNEILETEGDNILDFSEMDPWSEGDL